MLNFNKGVFMGKKGFTLVELMVVIVIIGVLAAVAIPRLMAAADRARAAEGTNTIGAIARMQHAYFVEVQSFLQLTGANPATPTVAPDPEAAGAAGVNWGLLGFVPAPTSRFFTYASTGAATQAAGLTTPVREFTVTATVEKLWNLVGIFPKLGLKEE